MHALLLQFLPKNYTKSYGWRVNKDTAGAARNSTHFSITEYQLNKMKTTPYIAGITRINLQILAKDHPVIVAFESIYKGSDHIS